MLYYSPQKVLYCLSNEPLLTWLKDGWIGIWFPEDTEICLLSAMSGRALRTHLSRCHRGFFPWELSRWALSCSPPTSAGNYMHSLLVFVVQCLIKHRGNLPFAFTSLDVFQMRRLCKIWVFHGRDYEECHKPLIFSLKLLGRGTRSTWLCRSYSIHSPCSEIIETPPPRPPIP
jgi:hypothetical protein